MKKYYAEIILIFFITICIFTGCGSGNSKSQTDGNINPSGEYVATINNMQLSRSSFNMLMYEEAEKFRDTYEIPENLTDEEYTDWVDSFWDREIDGKKPVDIVKERALDAARSFICLKQKREEDNYKVSDEYKADLEAGILSMLPEYNSQEGDEADKIFKIKFGVSKREYLDYMLDQRLNSLYIIDKSKDIKVSQDEINEYYNKYKDFYSVKTVQYVLLEAKMEPETESEIKQKKDKENKANKILQEANSGADFSKLVIDYSEDPYKSDNNGILIIDRESEPFVEDFMDWVNNASKGDVGMTESEIGFFVIKCLDEKVHDSVNEIETILKSAKYSNEIYNEINSEKYKPVIDDKIYSTITALPGDINPNQARG